MEIPSDAEKITLRANKKYKICTCGSSKTLPYCDNSHRDLNEKKGTSYKSLKIFPSEDITLSVFSKNWK